MKRMCPYCNGDIAIRNPSGYCDHLYYPELVPKEHPLHKPLSKDIEKYGDGKYQEGIIKGLERAMEIINALPTEDGNIADGLEYAERAIAKAKNICSQAPYPQCNNAEGCDSCENQKEE